MPIFKKGDKHNPSNYRPIVLLSSVGKIFERIIHKHLHNFMIDNNLIYKYQSGFLPNNSTVYQLLEIYHNICMGMEDKKNTCLVFCDISKAFDRVWHKGLLLKLEAYGVKGSLLQLLNNYLSERQQAVFVNNSLSQFQTVNAGVPQGSVLGPFLFLLYINDISDKLISLSRLFADDTSMSASSQNNTELKETLNHDLEELVVWSKKWKVKFNPDKTELLCIGKNMEDFNLRFGDSVILPVESHKHLGVTLASNAKWSQHIDNICKTALKEINGLRKLKYLLSRSALNRIYCTFILPLLEYACEVWGGCSKFDEDKLEKVQLEAARIVTGMPLFASRESLYFETGWETLKDRRTRRKLTLFHRVYNHDVPSFLSDIVDPLRRNNIRNLRNTLDFEVPNYRLQSTLNSYFPSTIRLWNNLEQDLRHNYTQNQFKSILNSRRDCFVIPSYYNVGDRKSNILLTKLRNSCSSLNADLFRVNLTDSPSCRCGHHNEDVFHYLFHCPLYDDQRQTLGNKLYNYIPLTAHKLLFGDTDLPIEDNSNIMLAVQKYITSTKRF